MMKQHINFSFVVHKGVLETQSILLVCSIRFIYKDNVDIYAGIPHHLGGINSGISDETRKTLSSLGVVFFEIENPIGKDYLIGNKLNCMPSIKNGLKIFLDTDMVLYSELELPIIPKNTIAIKSADRKTYKWSDGDWKYAYKKYSNISIENSKIYSTCFHQIMFPYYNSGMIVVNECLNFNSEWCLLSRKVDCDNKLQNKRPWLDQLCLPLVISKNCYKVINLSEKYNFPAHLKSIPIDKPYLVHYHWPNILSRDYKLIKYLRKLTTFFPVLLEVFKNNTHEWQELRNIISKQKLEKIKFNKNKQTKNIIITGIPRSGTSYFCSLLSKNDDSLVINEPKEVIYPLNRQPIPYGVDGYYSEIRKDVSLGKPIFNKQINGEIIIDTVINDVRNPYTKSNLKLNYYLFTKNTLGYIFAIERLKQVMPQSKVIALFRNPVDTIASWNNSFQHLKNAKPNEIKTIRLQHKWLSKKDNLMLMEINSCDNNCLRRALLWNYLAIRLIKNSHLIELVHYENLVLNPKQEINLIREKLLQGQNSIEYTPSDIQSKSSLLSETEIEIIKNTTSNIYEELLSTQKL